MTTTTSSPNDDTTKEPPKKRSRIEEETRDDAEHEEDVVPPSNVASTAAAGAGGGGGSPDNAALLEMIRGLQDNFQDLKKQNEDLQDKFKQQQDHSRKIECRLNRIAGVLDPAVEYALMETAVAKSVFPTIQKRGSSYNDKQIIDSISFGLASLCRDILIYLRDDAKDDPQKDKFHWAYKSKIVNRQDKENLLVAALRGLGNYIEHGDFTKLDAIGRNNIVHDGALLGGLFDSPESDGLDQMQYEARKNNARQCVQVFSENAAPQHTRASPKKNFKSIIKTTVESVITKLEEASETDLQLPGDTDSKLVTLCLDMVKK